MSLKVAPLLLALSLLVAGCHNTRNGIGIQNDPYFNPPLNLKTSYVIFNYCELELPAGSTISILMNQGMVVKLGGATAPIKTVRLFHANKLSQNAMGEVARHLSASLGIPEGPGVFHRLDKAYLLESSIYPNDKGQEQKFSALFLNLGVVYYVVSWNAKDLDRANDLESCLDKSILIDPSQFNSEMGPDSFY